MIMSVNKLKNIKDKINKEKEEQTLQNSYISQISRDNNLNIKSKYKDLLGRVREKSQEQALQINEINNYNDNFVKENNKSGYKSGKLIYSHSVVSMNSPRELKISNNINSFEITTKPSYNINSNSKNNRLLYDNDDELLISILNSKNSKLDSIMRRNNDKLNDQTLDAKIDFYDDNLFDLIDEIEKKEDYYNKGKLLSNSQLSQTKMNIDYEIERE
jgi:hypothetical protein